MKWKAKEALFQGRGTQPSTLTYTETVEDSRAKTVYPAKNRTTLQGLFFLLTPNQTSGHLASVVCGHSGPVSMYGMNWVTYSFMHARHVSMQGTPWAMRQRKLGSHTPPCHNHIVQCFSCCTAAQTSSVPHLVVADCALALDAVGGGGGGGNS